MVADCINKLHILAVWNPKLYLEHKPIFKSETNQNENKSREDGNAGIAVDEGEVVDKALCIHAVFCILYEEACIIGSCDRPALQKTL